ncbi:MAG: hypothetical protein ACTSRE_10400, partial [Promethearchaeota archaeon]
HTYRDTSGNSYDVQVSGNYAYIADGPSGLAVVDISTPFSPGATVYYEDTAGEARSVFISGDYAYIADKGAGFAVMDISDPTNPGTLAVETTNGDALGVWVEGDYAYVATSNGLNVINVTDPTNPDYLTMISSGYSSRVHIDGNYAYVAEGVDGLGIINITDPLNPSDLVYEDTDGFTHDVFISGNYAFCADNSSMAIIDVSQNLITPEVITHVTTTEDALDIDIEGNYAYLACRESGLAVIDISDPENPGSPVYATALGSILGVDVVGDYAFCAGFDEGLVIFDVSDPTYPHKVMNQTTTDECRGIYVEGNYAFIAADNDGLAIIDISDPMNPGTAVYKALGYTTDVEVQGNYAYTMGTYLSATDISDPTSPGTNYIKSGTGAPVGLDVCGNFVYMAAGDAGLNVFDITDPTSIGDPYEEDTIGYGRGVWISGNTAYIADNYDGGLARMDVTDPINPGSPSYTHTDTRAYEVQVHGDYAYLAVGEHSIQERGLCIVKVRERIDRYDPVIIDSPSDFSVGYGYSGESISWTATDQTNTTHNIELQGVGTVVSGENWASGDPIIYNIPDGFDPGDYTYTITFYDDDSHYVTDSVTFTVDLPTTPTIASGPINETISIGYSYHALEWTVFDDNPDWYMILLSGASPVVDPTAWTSGDSLTYILPTGLGAGEYLYRAIFQDDDTNLVYDDVNITIVDNLDPVVTQIAINVTAEEGYSGEQFNWTVTDDDPNTYTIELIGTGEVVGPTAWTSGDPIFYDILEGLSEGHNEFSINLTDNSGNFVNHTVWLVVLPDASAPIFTVPPSHILVGEGYTGQSFTWTATDANPDTYTVELIGSGIVAGPTIWTSGTQAVYNIPDGFTFGPHWYNITVTDDDGRFTSIIVTFNVTDSTDPVFTTTPSDITVEEGYTGQSFTWAATDNHPDTYTLELEGSGIISGPSTWTSGNSITYYIPDGLAPGEYTYTIIVMDDYGNSNSIEVTFTVTEKRRIPFGNTFLLVAGLSTIGLVVITIRKLRKRAI